jgi:pyruvate formate lyase activating enzyme
MLIGGLQKTTLIDYPGKIACTVFLIGCNFRCPWCYSAELVLPEKIKKQPKTSERDFFAFLKEKRGLLDGVVVCGGEPTIHKDLPDFIKKIRKLGFLVKLDTNGSNPEMLTKLIRQNLVDYVAMDVKAPLALKSKFQNQKYRKATGVKVNLKDIKKSIDIIKNSGVDYEFRTTVVPTIHSREDIVRITKDLAPARAYFLQNFRPEKTLDPKFKKIKPYPKDFILEIEEEVKPFFKVCDIR